MSAIPQTRPWKTAFFTIWAGQATSLLGSNLVQFAIVWWLTKATGSATVLATSSLVALLPGVVLGPFVGALVDRWNRRKVMVVADGVVAVASAVLAYLSWVHALQVWHVYVLLLVRALGGTFHWPAMQASTSLMVPHEHLPRVAGLNQALNGAMSIISPPLGALLLNLMPLHAIMGVDVATAALAIGLLLTVHVPQPEHEDPSESRLVSPAMVWADVRAGMQYVRSWPGILAAMVIVTLINFFLNPAASLLPLLVTQHFGGEVFHLSWMQSAVSVGMVGGGLTLSVWGGFRRRGHTSLTGLGLMGLGVLCIGLLPRAAFPAAVGAAFVVGFMLPMTSGPIFAVLQARVTPAMQGRVLTVVQSAASAMSPLAMIIAGPLSDLIGIRFWYVFAGSGCIIMAAVALALPAIRHLEDGIGRPIPQTGT